MNKQEEAVSRFKGPLNCSQSVFLTFAPLSGLDEKTALKLATPFGGGMAHLGEICGALSGAMMVIGLKTGMSKEQDVEAKDKTYSLCQELFSRFAKRNRSLKCRDLIGYDFSIHGQFEKAKESMVFERICPKFVRDAVEILEELFKETRIPESH